jgi:hypothetical protein
MDLKDVRIPLSRLREVSYGQQIAIVGWTLVDGLIVYRNGQRVGSLQEMTRDEESVTLSILDTGVPVH